MKKIIFIAFFGWLACLQSKGQNEQNVWAFGYYAGMNFNTSSPTGIINNLAPTDNGCASICNASGELLFYTNGCWVWNRLHELMPELTGGVSGITNPAYPIAYPPLMTNTGTWATQSVAVCGVPAQPGLYYVFSLSTIGQLYYSVVDMSLNGGLGGIVISKKGVGLASGLSEKLTVVKGCNNIWVVTRSKTANQYKAFEINDTGIVTTPVVSNVGLIPISWYQYGVIKFSPDGKKMVAACYRLAPLSGGLELYDFNPATGTLSNPVVLDSSGTKGYYYGACFSSNGTKLYASTSSFAYAGTFYPGKIRQFNLSLPTIPAIITSHTVVYTDNVYQMDNMGDLKRGKDHKIYFGSGKSSLPHLHRIDAPDNAGMACAVVPYAVPLPAGVNSERGLPNDIVLLPAPDTVSTKYHTSVCFSDSILLTAQAGKGYYWSNGSTDRTLSVTNNGQYIVRYINTACQYAIDTYAVHFYKLPVTGNSGYSCAGKKQGVIWLKTPVADTGSFLYTWKDANTNMIRQVWSNQGDTLSGLDTGSYAIHITTPNGCDTTLYTTILPLPRPQIAIAVDTVSCIGTPLHFTATTDAPVWSWHFGDGNTSKLLTTDHDYSQTGAYTVWFTATNIEGCSDTAIRTIAIKDLDLKLRTDKDLIDMGEVVNLQTSADEPYSVVAWEPSYLLPNQRALVQTLTLDTTQLFVVTGKSEQGCIGKASVLVSVTPNVFMPNAFSPNNDGLNDRFRPVATGYIFVRSFEIFNRYGQLIYAAQGQDVYGWDGTFKGEPMPLGTYYYHITVETKEKKTIYRKGDVILLR